MFDHKSKTTPDWDKGESGASRNMEPALHKEMDKEGNINADVKDFDVKKTFGISVLLKLTQKSINGIEILEANGRYRSNLDYNEMNQAVTTTINAHNIHLKVN